MVCASLTACLQAVPSGASALGIGQGPESLGGVGIERVELSYDAYYGPLRILSVTTRSAMGDVAYAIASEMRTVGWVGALFPWFSITEALGKVTGDRLMPASYRVEGEYRREPRRVSMRYLEEGQVQLEVLPAPQVDGFEPVAGDLVRGTIDPLSATLVVIRAFAEDARCARRLQVFDGRLRYDLELNDHGKTHVEADTPQVFSGQAQLCEALVHSIAGHPAEGRPASPRAQKMRYWFAQALPGRRPFPVAMELSGPRGSIQLKLTSAKDRTGPGETAPFGVRSGDQAKE